MASSTCPDCPSQLGFQKLQSPQARANSQELLGRGTGSFKAVPWTGWDCFKMGPSWELELWLLFLAEIKRICQSIREAGKEKPAKGLSRLCTCLVNSSRQAQPFPRLAKAAPVVCPVPKPQRGMKSIAAVLLEAQPASLSLVLQG